MGALTGDDDGRRPDSDGTPDVPPSVPTPWGELPIPDDVSELVEETAAVRRKLRFVRWRRRLRRLMGPDDDPQGPGIVGPLLIVVLAMTIGLGSLFSGFWPYQSNHQVPGGTRIYGVPHRLPDLVLTDAHGRRVRLADIRPSVIISVTRCVCTDLITQAAAMTRRKGITLVVVDQPTPADLPPSVLNGAPDRVLCLADPDGRLSRSLAPTRAPRHGTAMVVLVANDGSMAQVLADVRSAHQFAPGLDRLG